MPWEPDAQSAEQLKQVFAGSLNPNAADRTAANEALDAASRQPEFENYLFAILMDNQARSDIRAAAGSNLKNTINKKRHPRPYLLENVMKGLLVEDRLARNITGNIITALFSQVGVDGWPQALGQLFELATQAPQQSSQDAAMSALAKICEDSAYKLEREYNGAKPVEVMVPQLLQLMQSPSASSQTRALAISCLNEFIPGKPQALVASLDQFLTALFANAEDTSVDVRRQVCKAFALVLEARPDKMVPHLDGVVDYCLHLMDTNATGYSHMVAFEACEFLLGLAIAIDSDTVKYRPALDRVVPCLLANMQYSEDEIYSMALIDDRDQQVADSEQDIRPSAAKSKEHRAKTRDDDDSDDESDSDDEELEQWSLRKCAAQSLDLISTKLPADTLAVAFPILQTEIVSDPWPRREAAILAFGALSAPCIECAGDKLVELVPFLVERMQDPQPRVRQMSCWSVSQYADWIAEATRDGGDYASYFPATFEAVVQCALDPKKVVQESACSALSTFIEAIDPAMLRPFIGPLLQHFAKCCQVYQRKNLMVLYDCMETFMDSMGYEALTADPEYINTLLPPLLAKWESMDDDDLQLWPLLECMSVVAATFGDKFAPYAVPSYERAVKILSHCVHMDQQCHTDPLIDPPETNFMVTSLDLVDGLVQGFGNHSLQLIEHGSPATGGVSLMDLVLVCLENHSSDVRQSAYALLGDLAIHVLQATIAPHLDQLMGCIAKELHTRSYETMGAYNNAIWVLGEIAMRMPGGELRRYLANLVDLILPIMDAVDAQQSVHENCAICLGRFGFFYADDLAPRLPQFIVQWCTHTMYLLENEEKESAFTGLIKIIHVNPDAGFGGLSTFQGKKNLALFIACIGSYQEPSQDLSQLFHQLLTEYRAQLGPDGWQQTMGLVSADARNHVQQVYQV
ncbi:importin subunit beta-2 [Diutina catenulata]